MSWSQLRLKTEIDHSPNGSLGGVRNDAYNGNGHKENTMYMATYLTPSMNSSSVNSPP